MNTLSYDGCNFFRQRLIMAILSGKSVKIKKIRSKDNDPGLKDFEASFLRLIEKITNGSRVEINVTGTAVLFQPGMLSGGIVEHDCNPLRGIGYYMEALLFLAPFSRSPLKAVLRGFASLPVLKRFLGTDEGLELKINRRGVAPDGGGEVLFRCPTRQKLRPMQYTDPGKIKRIRGIAYPYSWVSPLSCNRMVDSTRSILNKFLTDIYIYTDHRTREQAGKSPGFGMTLVAETIEGTFLSADVCSNPKGAGNSVSVPEDLGKMGAKLLLEEIYRGGCVDSNNQSMAALFMALGDKDVSKTKIGPLSPYTISFLRHLKDFFQVMFKIDVESKTEDEEELKRGGEKILLTCVGTGFRNMSKVIL
ncbi:hypothetical protein CAPTEDRAFT_218453 [Capitella teleta]|uniref:RNA 3'-terminal phosphate cyclase domain-containing protein n=1 Tax=Capitella teleta TaxID=283909 RepID=R7VIS3_CAPTE|nr:hypothetical protein CAPTEDRAFT_218453 [Capitella teleta]|eukprot:ELU18728.1 hypothetical protein CAPTEDRAFT_218453 [Capitella teleta]